MAVTLRVEVTKLGVPHIFTEKFFIVFPWTVQTLRAEVMDEYNVKKEDVTIEEVDPRRTFKEVWNDWKNK